MDRANFTGSDDEAAFAELISLLANWDSDSDNQIEETILPPPTAAQALQSPSTIPAAPPTTKLQEKWKRQYYGRMNRLKSLREQVTGLEIKLSKLLAPAPVGFDAAEAATKVVSDPPPHPHLQTMLRLCVESRVKLQEENTKLRKLFRTYSQHAAIIQDLLLADHRPYAVDAGFDAAETTLMSEFRSVTLQECREIVDAGSSQIDACDPGGVQQPVSVCGWEGHRDVTIGSAELGDAMHLTFLLRKEFACSPTSATSRVWTIVTDPPKLANMFSTVFNMQLRFLQAIGDNTLLFYREMGGIGGNEEGLTLPSETAILLVSRRTLGDGDGYRIQLRTVNPSLLSVESDTVCGDERRSESLHWVEIRSADDGPDSGETDASCVVDFGGAVSIPPQTDGGSGMSKRVLELWAAEIVLQCLRAEAISSNVRFAVSQE